MKKDKNGLYRKKLKIGYNEKGNPIYKNAYGKTKEETEKKYNELLIQYNMNELQSSTITVNELCDIWIKTKLCGKSDAHIRTSNIFIDNYIRKQLGMYKINMIKPLNISNMINSMLQEKKFNSAKKTLQIVSSMFEMALNNDLINKNPCKLVNQIKYVKKQKRALSQEEQNKILNSNHKYADIYKVLLLTGMRKGEIVALTWDDIDFNNNTISINKAVDFTHNTPVIKTTKNGKSRIIPLLDKTRAILEPHAKLTHSKYVFCNIHGNMLSSTLLRKYTDKFKNDEQLNFTLHELRHTFCTSLFYSGVSSLKAQQIMGHSTLSVTMDIYTHLQEEMENNSSDLLNSFFGANTVRK